MDRDEVALILGLPPGRRSGSSRAPAAAASAASSTCRPAAARDRRVAPRPARSAACTRGRSRWPPSPKRHPARIAATFGADADGRLTGVRFHGDFDTGAYASWGPTVANRVPVHAMGPYAGDAVARGHDAAPSTRTTRRPARSAASACPRRRSPTRRCSTSSRTSSASTGSSSGCRNALRAGSTDRDRPGARGERRARRLPRGAPAALGRAARRGRRRTTSRPSAPATAPARRRHRGHVVRDRQHLAGQPLDDRDRRRARRPRRPVLRRGRHRPGRLDRRSPRSPPTPLGVPVAALELVARDTDRTADAGKSSASRQTFVSGNAARLAGEDLRRQILSSPRSVGDAPSSRSRRPAAATGGCGSRDGDERRRSCELPRAAGRRGAGCVLAGRGTFDPETTPSTPTARASRTRPTRSARRSPRSRSTPSSGRSRSAGSSRRTTSGGRSTRPRSRARSTAASRRASAWR